MSDKYDQMAPLANKLIDDDDTMQTFEGSPVEMSGNDSLYDKMSPLKNEVINPDGSRSKLTDVIGGGGGGGDVTIVQSTGQSTTSVMSQKATTDMVLNPTNGTVRIKSTGTNGADSVLVAGASATGSKAISIGYGSTAVGSGDITIGDTAITGSGSGGVAIGSGAEAKAAGVAIGKTAKVADSASRSVALGSESRSARQYEVSVGSGIDSDPVETRLIGNVTDPELAQDVATKNYVDSEMTTATTDQVGVNTIKMTTASTVDFTKSIIALNITSNQTITVPSGLNGRRISINLYCDATVRTITWAGASIKWLSTPPTLIANKLTAITLLHDGINLVGMANTEL